MHYAEWLEWCPRRHAGGGRDQGAKLGLLPKLEQQCTRSSSLDTWWILVSTSAFYSCRKWLGSPRIVCWARQLDNSHESKYHKGGKSIHQNVLSLWVSWKRRLQTSKPSYISSSDNVCQFVQLWNPIPNSSSAAAVMSRQRGCSEASEDGFSSRAESSYKKNILKHFS